ncbi:uncharacterized protein MICPUCDRAFT_52486 [Micromonas pusilla CCMP1545]|uniref:Predicted protein n=1 Tax=Micromonas pusilla (strain CCMP1545) TaxID=564608 RepID=C1N4A9_MICPC|nr:uncharacterized protein MICPUCDRAFT_52486 [Micromonas pusilla CCMP1545]EEH52907.1 predicted protein [Micromonas pusilla CCMP1545]|eukprot:XP_003062968.1 predicted protein [Micromonas pusilla CCMP1545]
MASSTAPLATRRVFVGDGDSRLGVALGRAFRDAGCDVSCSRTSEDDLDYATESFLVDHGHAVRVERSTVRSDRSSRLAEQTFDAERCAPLVGSRPARRPHQSRPSPLTPPPPFLLLLLLLLLLSRRTTTPR